MISSSAVKEATVGLFLLESERDKQRKVGASQISDPCTKHLARALMQFEEPPMKYWLGGKVGTAVHSFIEAAIEKTDDDFFADAIVEQKIELGEIEGYGLVSSKPDLVLPSKQLLIDWKTTTRAKIKKVQSYLDGTKLDIETEYTLQKYLGQANLYAWGLKNQGTPISDISIVFINRDGTYENDIYVLNTEYDEQLAVDLWQRVSQLWAELESGASPDDYPNHDQCFKCNIGI
jgi:hypothetical protein